jgi:hypothetical protein
VLLLFVLKPKLKRKRKLVRVTSPLTNSCDSRRLNALLLSPLFLESLLVQVGLLPVEFTQLVQLASGLERTRVAAELESVRAANRGWKDAAMVVLGEGRSLAAHVNRHRIGRVDCSNRKP